MNKKTKLLCLDCDSTISSIEGIDELAALKNTSIQHEVIHLTNQAMSGQIKIEHIFRRRLNLIKPSRKECHKVGELYIETIAKDIKETICILKELGWTPIIISGGFLEPITPLAHFLGIEEVYAVPLQFDTNGNYLSYTESPTTRNGGKPEIIKSLIQKYNPSEVTMIGDGVSDLECQSPDCQFIGYGEFAEREVVKKQAHNYCYTYLEIRELFLKKASL